MSVLAMLENILFNSYRDYDPWTPLVFGQNIFLLAGHS